MDALKTREQTPYHLIHTRRLEMPAGIERHDGAIYHQTPAWHRLGYVVQEAPTPVDACQRIGADFTVEKWYLGAFPEIEWIETEEHGRVARFPQGYVDVAKRFATVRTDLPYPLGVVGNVYQPVQNLELAKFCEALAEMGDTIKIESAGTLRNGEKIWYLLKGESFSVREDEQIPYLCISNGHNGWLAVRGTPCIIRVVCENTLHMVVPSKEYEGPIEKVTEGSFVALHTGDIKDKLQDAKRALKLYGHRLEETKRVINQLAARDVNSNEMKEFFMQCYVRDFGNVPTTPTDGWERRRKEKAMDAFRFVETRFEMERDVAGATVWNLYNSYTNYLQHERKPGFKDPVKARESQVNSILFGRIAEKGTQTLNHALALSS
jgi:phage/plasmid-like protein (TIGR03299 family)